MSISSSSGHGGARPGAGRKPKSPLALSNLPAVTDPKSVAQIQERLTESLPELIEALLSSAQSPSTAHERWVASGTLTVGKGEQMRPLFPDLPADQLVLVSRDTYTHKPDLKALLFLLEHLLTVLSADTQTQSQTQTTPTASSPSPDSTPAVSYVYPPAETYPNSSYLRRLREAGWRPYAMRPEPDAPSENNLGTHALNNHTSDSADEYADPGGPPPESAPASTPQSTLSPTDHTTVVRLPEPEPDLLYVVESYTIPCISPYYPP